MLLSEDKQLSIVVASCDAYSDAWHPFFFFFFKYWNDCPFPVYLVSNFLKYNDQRIKPVCLGEEVNWSRKMKAVLDQIPTRNVLYLQEDYFFNAKVLTSGVEDLYSFFMANGCLYLRLCPCPAPQRVFRKDLGIGVIDPGAPYRVSLQAAVWDKQTFRDLLLDGESIWDFEIIGSRRSDKLAGFYSLGSGVSWPIPYFSTAISGGKWVRKARELCRKERVPVYSCRKVDTSYDEFERNFQAIRNIRQKIQKIFIGTGKT